MVDLKGIDFGREPHIIAQLLIKKKLLRSQKFTQKSLLLYIKKQYRKNSTVGDRELDHQSPTVELFRLHFLLCKSFGVISCALR